MRNRQHYCDLNVRPFDWQDRIVMCGASIVGAVWLVWIIEGLCK